MDKTNIKLGIIDVIWDFDDVDEKRKAFFELSIYHNNNLLTFRNNFYFLDKTLCVSTEYTETNVFKLNILEEDGNLLKICLCDNIIFITKEQYNLLNEKITLLQDKLNFDVNIHIKY